MITRLVHMAHIVENMEEALQRYRKVFNAEYYYDFYIEVMQLRVCQIHFGDNFIELVQPPSQMPSWVPEWQDFRKFINERGSGISHVLV